MKKRAFSSAGFFALVTLVLSSCHTTPVKKLDVADGMASIESQARELASTQAPIAAPLQAGGPTCLPCSDGGRYQVHLTFDDGPYKKLTQKILTILREKRVNATFFELTSAYSSKQTERNLSNYDDVTRQTLKAIESGIHDGGHQLACHTLEHIDHVDPAISLTKAEFNILRGIQLAPKGSSKYLRLPYGRGWYKETPGSEEAKRADVIMSYIHELGYKHLGWDIDSFDWAREYQLRQPRELLGDICSQKGGVILMHDIQPFEAQTLANTIDAIRCSGHEIVGLGEIEALNKKRGLTSFKDRADYTVIHCPRGLGEIKTGKCLIKPTLN